MMLLRRGSQNETVTNLQPIESGPSDGEALNSYAFIAQHEGALIESAASWSRVIDKLHDAFEPFPGHFYQGIASGHKSLGLPLPDTDDRSIQRATSELISYGWLTTRKLSGEAFGFRDILNLPKVAYDDWMSIPDPAVRSGLDRTERFDHLINDQVGIAAAMKNADAKREELLEAFSSAYFSNPDALDELDELYSSGVAEVSPLFHELRQCIAADWLSPDRDKSLLRRRLQAATEDPKRSGEAFSHYVVDSENSKHRAIQNMAKFAVLASGKPLTKEAMAQALINTQAYWPEVDGIDPAYGEYVKGELHFIEGLIDHIVGNRQQYGLRVAPDSRDLERMRKAITLAGEYIYAGDRTSRRRVRAQAQKAGTLAVPSIAELEPHLAQDKAETEARTARMLMLIKSLPNGQSILEEADVAVLAEKFKMDYSDSLKEIIPKMIDWLLAHPISPASHILHIPPIKIEGSKYRLWRLAPAQIPDLRVGNRDRDVRLVYALTPNALGVRDILRHEEFDKKFS